jgi:hypothetical protein
MGYKRTSKVVHHEEQLQKAILAFNNHEFNSVRGAINTFNVSHRTMSRRLDRGKSRAQAREITQILLNAEEKTLV